MLQACLRALALIAVTATLAGCVVYQPAPGYAYAAPPPPVVYGPPVYGSVVIGGGGWHHWR